MITMKTVQKYTTDLQQYKNNNNVNIRKYKIQDKIILLGTNAMESRKQTNNLSVDGATNKFFFFLY